MLVGYIGAPLLLIPFLAKCFLRSAAVSALTYGLWSANYSLRGDILPGRPTDFLRSCRLEDGWCVMLTLVTLPLWLARLSPVYINWWGRDNLVVTMLFPPESMISVLASEITICVVGVTLKWAIIGALELIEALRLGLSPVKSYSPVVIGKSSGAYCMFREKRCWGKIPLRSLGVGPKRSPPAASCDGRVCIIMTSRAPFWGETTWLIDDSCLSPPWRWLCCKGLAPLRIWCYWRS